MRRCIQLALMGAGNVAPNPLVGSVLVHDDKIIGEGYHEKYGEAHAEVNCINSVSQENQKNISKSILYVSLEPCAHVGKTPACTNLILEKNIKRNCLSLVSIHSTLISGKNCRLPFLIADEAPTLKSKSAPAVNINRSLKKLLPILQHLKKN